MKAKLGLALVLLILSLGFVSANPDEKVDKTIHMEESVEIKDYIIELDTVSLEDTENEFKISYNTGKTLRVLERVRGNEIFDLEGEKLDISDELDVKIDYIGSDSSGLYFDLSVDADPNLLSHAEISSTTPERIAVEQGEELTIPLELENEGFTNQSFKLNESTEEIGSSFKFDGFTVTEVEVNSGETETVNLDLEIPELIDPQNKQVEVQASNQTKITDTIELDIQGMEKQRSMTLNTNNDFIREQPGETISTTLRIRNEGETPLNDIEIELESPEDWETNIQPEEVSALEPFESQNVEIEAEIPPNADLGDEFLEISASSDQIESDDPEEIRVNIAEDSNMTYIGLLLMTTSLGILIGVYKKFGRR